MTATNIEWADKVWNPVTGCTKVSQGCKHCYAEVVADRFFATQYPPIPLAPVGTWRDGAPCSRQRRFTDVQTHPNRLTAPLAWKKPQRIFVNSMSDLFHEDVPDAFIDQVFAVMALCPQHTFIILTKRPERMRDYCASDTTLGRFIAEVAWLTSGIDGVRQRIEHKPDGLRGMCLPNVILGVSIEDQATANERIPILLQTPTARRAVMLEPLVEAVYVTPWVNEAYDCPKCRDHWSSYCGSRCCPSCRRFEGVSTEGVRRPTIDWLIIGVATGKDAPPCDLAWIRSLIQQGKAAGVPVWVERVGSNPTQRVMYGPATFEADQPVRVESVALRDRSGADPSEWPDDLRVRQMPEVVNV